MTNQPADGTICGQNKVKMIFEIIFIKINLVVFVWTMYADELSS
jgi:hypothetical protein